MEKWFTYVSVAANSDNNIPETKIVYTTQNSECYFFVFELIHIYNNNKKNIGCSCFCFRFFPHTKIYRTENETYIRLARSER